VSGTIVDDPEHAPSAVVGLGGHDLLDEAPERHDRGLLLAAADQPAVEDVPGGEVAQRAAAVVVVLDALGAASRGSSRRVAALARLDLVFSSAQITKSPECNRSPCQRRS